MAQGQKLIYVEKGKDIESGEIVDVLDEHTVLDGPVSDRIRSR